MGIYSNEYIPLYTLKIGGSQLSSNELIIIPKIEKYIEYMLTVLLKLPRTEKFSIGTEVKQKEREYIEMHQDKQVDLYFNFKQLNNIKQNCLLWHQPEGSGVSERLYL